MQRLVANRKIVQPPLIAAITWVLTTTIVPDDTVNPTVSNNTIFSMFFLDIDAFVMPLIVMNEFTPTSSLAVGSWIFLGLRAMWKEKKKMWTSMVGMKLA